MSSDDRSFLMQACLTMSPAVSAAYFYPRVIALVRHSVRVCENCLGKLVTSKSSIANSFQKYLRHFSQSDTIYTIKKHKKHLPGNLTFSNCSTPP